MKKVLYAFVILAASASLARAATAAVGPLQSVPNGNTFAIEGLEYYGSSSYYLEASTPALTAVQFLTGSGFFYGLECSSGTLGDFALIFDSASAGGITVSTPGKSLTPAVFTAVYASTTSASTYFGAGSFGKYVAPNGAKRFTHGLVGIKSGSGNANCLVSALLDSVIQAVPQTH